MRRSSPQDKVDPAEALMREVGAQLRQVRLERGEDLETAAQYLRIKPAYLAGIEEGDLSTLPGRTYALGFLRSYAAIWASTARIWSPRSSPRSAT